MLHFGRTTPIRLLTDAAAPLPGTNRKIKFKDGDTHNTAWHLSQSKYLLALAAGRAKHPNMSWYLLVDSDTLVFPWRLSHGILTRCVKRSHELALVTR
jgi:hypothetical protein